MRGTIRRASPNDINETRESLRRERLHLRHATPDRRELLLQFRELFFALLDHLRGRLLDKLGRLEPSREPVHLLLQFTRVPPEPRELLRRIDNTGQRKVHLDAVADHRLHEVARRLDRRGGRGGAHLRRVRVEPGETADHRQLRRHLFHERGVGDDHERGDPLRGLHRVLCARVANGSHDALHRLERADRAGVPLGVQLRPALVHDGISAVRQRPPHLLGDVRHERVQHAQGVVQDVERHGFGGLRGGWVVAVQPGLGPLDEPIREIVVEERVRRPTGFAKVVPVVRRRDVVDDGVQPGHDPSLREGQGGQR
mmetsp:Transcript_10350/g.42854  ORF Transcript_10350/g.42854 Transcript_10350/m.42854 type:complete len:312 (+) Transcript_10350:1352-2287(+)